MFPKLMFDIYGVLQAETKFYNGLLYYGEGGISLYPQFSFLAYW